MLTGCLTALCQWTVSRRYTSASYSKMDNTYTSKPNGENTNVIRISVFLFLAGFHPVLSSDGKPSQLADSGLKPVIIGPNYVTVGVPSSIECGSSCGPCTYSMSLDGQSAVGQSNMLAFTINSWVPSLTVTCTVSDDKGLSATATKNIQVLAGPTNVSISGPSLMNPTVSHTYNCYAYCHPSCYYSWRTDKGPWIRGQGNVVSITPREMDTSKTVTCKATNNVSGLFATATQNIAVTFGPSKVQIEGPDVVEIAETYKYVCTAECHPSCRFLSSVDSQTVRGNVIEMTVDHPLKSVTLKCEAQNTASRKTVTALKTVRMKVIDRSLSTRPEETSALLLLAFGISAAFTL
ncbi:uncharacterized protein LOC116323204 [Oreochromis aureus]|uniref:uncharacterized protein LOC116323204 n=1 Tax=Oreochromis aureus TaxID=47969 RepID=UPI0012BB8B24|nr:uncharacterized protein LOC116323204 [Oreochromis aureus]